jgi:gluconolactonase
MVVALLLALVVSAEAEGEAVLKKFRSEFVVIEKAQPPLDIAMAKYEVTQELWQSVMGENPSRWKGSRNSAEMFTYAEAEQFCATATALLREQNLIKSSEVVRLPTEEEWETCCRAGTETRYSFGDDLARLGDYAWFTGNAAGNDPPVGKKKPNAWGLYDMHGYLWEMCSGEVARGGSWKDAADRCTCTSRRQLKANERDDDLGLRCVLAPATTPVSTAAKPTAQESIADPAAKFEVVWGEGEFTEGPALGADGRIYFSDIGNRIYVFDPKTKKTEVYRDPSGRSNGLIFDAKGRLFAAEGANSGGGRRISVTEKDGKVRTLADRYEGKRFNSPNDIALDAQGNVYFTDPRYVGEEPRELDFEAVFRITPEGKVTVATREAKKPNGIVFSPNGKHCYVAENNPAGKRHLLRFSVAKDGTLIEPKVLHDFGTGRGIDGMTTDTAGNVYATAGTGELAGIYVFDPEGALLAFLPTPGDPTNCEFGGGEEKNVLYVTSALPGKPTKYGLARITLKKTGR